MEERVFTIPLPFYPLSLWERVRVPPTAPQHPPSSHPFRRVPFAAGGTLLRLPHIFSKEERHAALSG